MFFRKTRQNWQQRKTARREAARLRLEEKLRRRQACIEEFQLYVKRLYRKLAIGLAIVLSCCGASFVYGAYSAGQIYGRPVALVVPASQDMAVPVSAATLPVPAAPHSESASGRLLPDTTLTPGELDPEVTFDVISGRNTHLLRHVSISTAECAWSVYHVLPSERHLFRLDHLIPIELGGASDSCRNLWPQSIAEAARKDQLETVVNKLVRHGQIKLRDAQIAIAGNWIAMYARYVMQPTVNASAATTAGYSIPHDSVRHLVAFYPPRVAVASSTMTCADGSGSRSKHRSGACSHHGGIR